MSVSSTDSVRRKAVWGARRTVAGLGLGLLLFSSSSVFAASHHARTQKARPGRPNSLAKGYKVDGELAKRSHGNGLATTRVIVELRPGAAVPPSYRPFMRRNGKLGIINGQVLDLPNRLITQMSQHPDVFRLHFDRPTKESNYLTSLTTGTRAVQKTLGLTGAGVGVVIIDSGIATWHDDLTIGSGSASFPFGNQRVAAFMDFVNGQLLPYDDNGHGSHVAGIIAGNGVDSNGKRMGAAPDASLVSLKVLDANGAGTISQVIQALDWVLANHEQYNIRVVNMSVSTPITESYWTDPLTLAAKRVVDAGVLVVVAAGNHGKNAAGQLQYGGIGSPGNAPWVLTVGASSTNGTPVRGDDTVATFSSRGPTYLDWAAKPDVVAPGAGTVSLAVPGSMFFATRPSALVNGGNGTPQYLSLSGTSMAAPHVAGVAALMLQANPALTPNAIKAILQYTAQEYPGVKRLEQGAGFVNAIGAVRLARFYATAQPGDPIPMQRVWSKHIFWGNHMLTGGVLNPAANAFAVGTNWGVAQTDNGDNIVWGTDDSGANIVWATDTGDNIVWGTDCGGADCDNIAWGSADADNIVWGTADSGDNIVWGTAGLDVDNIVWGTADLDNIIWGSNDGDNIIWGSNDGDNIVWGTDDGNDNIVWGTSDDDNIVWGTDDGDDNIVWGTDDGDNIVWGTDDGDNIIWGSNSSLNQVWEESPDGTKVRLSGAGVFDKISDGKLLRLIESSVHHVTVSGN